MMPRTAHELYSELDSIRNEINATDDGVATDRNIYAELCKRYDDVPEVDFENLPQSAGGLLGFCDYIISLVKEKPVEVNAERAPRGIDEELREHDGARKDKLYEKIKEVSGCGCTGVDDATCSCGPNEACSHCPPVRMVSIPSCWPLPRETGAGLKYDSGKPMMELLDGSFLLGVAEVLTYGAVKYEAENWRKGIAYKRVFGALMRHLWAWHSGEYLDPESGLPHLHHAGCCLMFLSGYESRPELYAQFDDRWIGETETGDGAEDNADMEGAVLGSAVGGEASD